MRVLGLCSYPIESAATRYRLAQFIEPLAKKGVDLTVSPFFDSKRFKLHYEKKSPIEKFLGLGKPILQRILEVSQVHKFDLLFIQREAIFFGPAFFERLFQIVGSCPMVLDLDDATYIRYISPTYGKIGSLFKFFGKTDSLIKKAEIVTCGNRHIAEYVELQGTKSVVIPTVVDINEFQPVEKTNNSIPIVGWIGTHSTFPFLRSIFPVLEKLGKKHEFILKIVGAGTDEIELKGVKVENLQWSLDREIADFQSFDIGLYPMSKSSSANEEWLIGKSGFKAVQYMAVGIPFVMTPIGVCAEIGEPDKTHFNARTEEEWMFSLNKLLSDANLRKEMGKRGRRFSLNNFTVPAQAELLAQTFYTVCKKR
ncbi:glycosyltransferase family 4 protein [soil metagenome]